MALHDSAAHFLVRNNRTILGCWFIVYLVAIYNGPALFKCFEIALKVHDDTESGRAAKMVEHGLPDFQDRMEDAVVVWCDDCDTVVGKESRRVMNKLAGWLEGVGQRFPGLIKTYESYYDLEDLKANNPYISTDKKTMLFHWSFTAGPQIREGFDLFNAEVEALNAESPLHIVSSGSYANFRGAERIMFGYIMKDEMFVVPFIALILWFMLGSIKRSCVPFLCATLSIASTWTTLLFIKKVIWPEFNMVITLPFITAAFAVALCVDYGLFLWGRFGEERSKGVILEESISIMLGYSGHVVLVSGCVMIVAYFSVICYPHANSIEILSLGVGNMLAAFYSIISSLTITPCLIAAFPQHLDSDTSEHERLYRRMKPGKYWKKWAVMITRPPWIVLVPLATYLAIAPVSLQLQNFQESFNTWSLLMAHSTPEFAGHRRVENSFPRGTTMPMMVALQLSDHTHPTQFEHTSNKLNARQLLRQTGDSSNPFDGMFQNPFTKNMEEMLPFAGANAGFKPANFFQPQMWQDMADAISKSDAGQKDGQDILGNVMDMFSGGLLGKNRKKGLGSFMQLDGGVKKSAIRSAEFYMYSCALAKELIKETKGKPYQIDPDDVLSLFYLPPSQGGGKEGKCLDWQMAQFLLQGNNRALDILGLPNKLNIGKQYRRAFSKLANDDGQVSVMLIRPKFDPMSPIGTQAAHAIRGQILPKFRGLLQIAEGEYAADTSFFSILSLMMDVQAQLYAAAPRILGLTILAMFTAIAFMFKSAFVPVKLVLTVVVPLTFVYGAAVAVFQNGALDFLGIEQLSAMGGVSWEMPLFTFCVLMGLALDYDIFLFARVVEYRQKGYDNRSAVIKGMCTTGPIISAAGAIMALAFMGNMMGPFGYDNQIGFIMCVGVLVDTFVIRMCLVPCFLCMLEGLNYWPVKMPTPTKVDRCLLADAKDADFEVEEEDD